MTKLGQNTLGQKKATKLTQEVDHAGSGTARTVGGLGGSAPQHHDEIKGLRSPQAHVPQIEWARGELNPHVLTDTRT